MKSSFLGSFPVQFPGALDALFQVGRGSCTGQSGLRQPWCCSLFHIGTGRRGCRGFFLAGSTQLRQNPSIDAGKYVEVLCFPDLLRVMPCSSLYFNCFSRRRLVSSMVSCMLSVILSAYMINHAVDVAGRRVRAVCVGGAVGAENPCRHPE